VNDVDELIDVRNRFRQSVINNSIDEWHIAPKENIFNIN